MMPQNANKWGYIRKWNKIITFLSLIKRHFHTYPWFHRRFKYLEMIAEKNSAIRFFYNLQLFIKKILAAFLSKQFWLKKDIF